MSTKRYWLATNLVRMLTPSCLQRTEHKLEFYAVGFYPIFLPPHYTPSAMALVRNNRKNEKTAKQRRIGTIHLLSPLTHSHQQLYKRLQIARKAPHPNDSPCIANSFRFTGKSHPWYSWIQRDSFVTALAIFAPQLVTLRFWSCKSTAELELLARTLGHLHFEDFRLARPWNWVTLLVVENQESRSQAHKYHPLYAQRCFWGCIPCELHRLLLSCPVFFDILPGLYSQLELPILNLLLRLREGRYSIWKSKCLKPTVFTSESASDAGWVPFPIWWQSVGLPADFPSASASIPSCSSTGVPGEAGVACSTSSASSVFANQLELFVCNGSLILLHDKGKVELSKTVWKLGIGSLHETLKGSRMILSVDDFQEFGVHAARFLPAQRYFSNGGNSSCVQFEPAAAWRLDQLRVWISNPFLEKYILKTRQKQK